MSTIEIKKVLLKRGNTAQSEAYVGALGEVTIDTGLDCLRIHDGVTPGGAVVASTATTIQGVVNDAISGLLNGAPEALDTLKELADALGNNSNSITDILTTLSSKANIVDLATVAQTGSYNDLTDTPAPFSGLGDLEISGSNITGTDGVVRLQTQNVTQTAYYNFTPSAGYSTAVWNNNGITFNDPTQEIYTAIWALTDLSTVEIQINGQWQTVTYGGSSTPGWPAAPTLWLQETAVNGPLNIDVVDITIRQGTESYVEVDGSDFRVDVQDDIRMYGNDTFRLVNRSADNSIEIETNDGEYTWAFRPDGGLNLAGNLQFPNGAEIRNVNGDLRLRAAPGDAAQLQGLTINGAVDAAVKAFHDIGTGSYVTINTNIDAGAPEHVWTFDYNGDLTVPNYINFAGNTFIGDEPSAGTPYFRIDTPLGYAAKITTDSDISGNNWSWTFGEDGNLTIPGDIHGAPVISGGAFPSQVGRTVNITPADDASDKKFKFRVDQYGETFTRAYLELPTAEVDKQVAAVFPHTNGKAGYIFTQGANTNDDGMNDAFNIFYNNGDIKITSMGSLGGLYTWKFGDDGSLTLPDNGVVSAGGSGGLTLGGNFDVKIVADYTDNDRTWTFNGTDGSLTFPNNSGSINSAVSDGGGLQVEALIDFEIKVTQDADVAIWSFDPYGDITFPDGTIQTTAWTGSVSYNNLTDVPTIPADISELTDTSNLLGSTYTAGTGVDITDNVISVDATVVTTSGSQNITTTGNITAANFVGNITITGNVTGTSANVELVAGSYTWTFDNTGVFTVPAGAGSGGGDEGGEIQLVQATNSTLSGNTVIIDNYIDKVRIFEEGNPNKGVYIDLSQAGAGVGTLLNNRVSAFVDAGTFVTMDNIKATVPASGNRGLSLATTTGSITYNISATYGGTGGFAGSSVNAQTLTTTPTSSIFGWNFGSEGEVSTYVLIDKTNSRAYRITLSIGPAYLSNMISIERLV